MSFCRASVESVLTYVYSFLLQSFQIVPLLDGFKVRRRELRATVNVAAKGRFEGAPASGRYTLWVRRCLHFPHIGVEISQPDTRHPAQRLASARGPHVEYYIRANEVNVNK